MKKHVFTFLVLCLAGCHKRSDAPKELCEQIYTAKNGDRFVQFKDPSGKLIFLRVDGAWQCDEGDPKCSRVGPGHKFGSCEETFICDCQKPKCLMCRVGDPSDDSKPDHEDRLEDYDRSDRAPKKKSW